MHCRQCLGSARDFENLGHDGRLMRPVAGQLAALGQPLLRELIDKQHLIGLLPTRLHAQVIEPACEASYWDFDGSTSG